MTEHQDSDLERTAGAVADQTPLDWDLEAAEHPELRTTLAGLRALERLAAAHRAVRQQHQAGGEAVLAETADRAIHPADAALQEPVFCWGFLRALEHLGGGSFGEVWRAWDPTLEREVALKLRRLAPVAPGESPLMRTSDPATRHWLEEARRLASVRHPNVLVVHGAAEHDGRAGLWTELVQGETLEERLQREGTFEPREAARIGRDLCEALAVVHAAGLVHGDVKTSNVMLESPSTDRAGPSRVVLMDFGTAHHATAGGAGSISSAGTPLVMAPEVMAGEPATPAADLYSVGVLLQRLVTGRYPVEADSIEDLRAMHARGERLPLAKLRPGVPHAFVRIVERSLAPSPAERFASAAECGRALGALAEPARGRRGAVMIAASIAVALAALALAFFGLQRPAAVRYVPPDRLPGPHVSVALVLGDIAVGATPGERFGDCEAGVGDVNKDGFDDIVVAATRYSGALTMQGRAQLFLGNASGQFGKPVWSAVGRQASAFFGAHLAPAGDVNGDGYDDVLVADSWMRESDHRQMGSVSLYLGTAQGLAPEPATRLTGWQPEATFGNGLAGVGDVNRDGYGDVIVTARNYTRRFPYEGAAFLFAGGPHGLEPRPRWAVYGGARDAWLGYIVSRTGDVNGDGYGDLMVGAPGWKGEGTGAVGRVQLFLGGPRGLSSDPAWTAVGDHPAGQFGYSVGGVGDVNADGCADFAIIQPFFSGRGVGEGRTLLYLGGPHGPGQRPVWTGQGFSSNTVISSKAPGIGDVNGDGVPDIMVGSADYSGAPDRLQLGIVAVYLSPRDPRKPHPVWYRPGDDPGTPISHWEAPAGDFNGDGLADLVVAQPGWSSGDFRGRTLLFLGHRVKLPK